MEIRENLLSSATFEEKSSWNTVFRAENWVGSMEASLAKNPEKFCWKGSNDHCAETGDRRFPITDSQKTVTLKSTGSELKPQTDRANVNVIDGWSQKSKEYKSRAAQTECEMISVGITCQVKDLIVSSNNETSPSGNSVVSSCNKVMVAINDAETKSIDVSSPTSIPEDEMKDILTAEESDDQELEHLESYSALTQNKRSGEFTEASSHTETNKIRFSNQPNQIDLAASVENTPMESRNSILEWSRNVFRTVRSLEEGTDVDGVRCDVDIRNNKQIITASNPWPSLTDRFHRYLRNFVYGRNAVRLILRYLFIIYLILLHGAFFRCIIL